MISQWKFFLKYSLKQISIEAKNIVRSLKGVLRPRFWFFIFSLILIYQLWNRRQWGSLGSLAALLFIWAWSVYVSGAWKHEYRTESIKNIKRKVERELSADEKKL